MFIAHALAGYIAACLVDRAISRNEKEAKTIIYLGLLFSILPDLDMIYFYTIDNRQHLHHSYWTHIPIFWIACSFFLLAVSGVMKTRLMFLCALMLLLESLIHLVLDTVVGGIFWLYPFNSTAYTLFVVPAQQSHWVLNFLVHWTFLLELGILLLAGIVLGLRMCRDRRPREA